MSFSPAVLEYGALRLRITEYREGPREKQVLGERAATRVIKVNFVLVVMDYGALRLRITEVLVVVSVFRNPYSNTTL